MIFRLLVPEKRDNFNILLDIQMERVRSSSAAKESENRRKEKETPRASIQIQNRKTRILLGVCAMKKKVESKPMKEILSRLKCPEIQILEMWQCLEQPWTKWPIVDALICFFSDGFPYLMAWKYVNRHKPFLINDLEKQQLLWDRTVIYDILDKIKVPVARHYFVYRDEDHLKKIEEKCFGRLIEQEKWEDEPMLQRLTSECETSDTKIFHKMSMSARHTLTDHPVSSLEGKTQEKEKQKQKQKQKNSNSLDKKQDQFDERASKTTKKKGPIKIQDEIPTLLREYYYTKALERTNFEIDENQDDNIVLKSGDQCIKLKKPFVQKPFDSQNHEICVYYPSDMGGGRKKLFRKKKNSSSQYQAEENTIRRDGNYIYEQYLPTNAFDIKVYTIGPYYMYAEARKSPTLDGVVLRNKEGKEVRYPVILTPDQKYISNRIVEQFGQDICGFDLLRANGKSYVCDVNGWSFVKGNPKYWQDCATILRKKILNHFCPEKLLQRQEHDRQQRINATINNSFRPPLQNLNPKVEELRSIVSIFRHADRSPKMKLKIKTKDSRFLEYFNGIKKDELKFKDAKNMTQFLNIANEIISELTQDDPMIKDFMQVKLVLETGGHFEGLTRKMQLKVIEREQGEEGKKGKVKKVMVILKWGGDLTNLGYEDAIELGQKMRNQRYGDNDCLSLYSSYRHDLKTYASDQGRCIKTAAAFLKGFLSIQGQLAPIIVSMIQADAKAQRLLDCTHQQNHSPLGDKVCERLAEIMNRDQDLYSSVSEITNIQNLCPRMIEIIKQIGKPRQKMMELHKYIIELVNQIERIYLESEEDMQDIDRRSNSIPVYDNENILLVNSRWSKLKKDFYNNDTDKFNISKIPEIFDVIRHDNVKNKHIFVDIDPELIQQLYGVAKLLAHFVVINQLGINDKERIQVATDICLPLLEKILVDLMFWKEKSEDEGYWKYKNPTDGDNWRHIRTRLYFTSASHMYSLLNILTRGNDRILLKKSSQQDASKIFNIIYMSYLSHIQFRLYENLTIEEQDPNRFRLQITFSTKFHKDEELKQYSLGGKGFTINEIQQFIQYFLDKKKCEEDKKEKKND